MHATLNLRPLSAGAGVGGGAIALAASAAALTRRCLRARTLRREVSELMSTPVRCVGEHESVAKAAERLAEDGIGAVAVCDGDQRLVGMLSDRDIVVRVVAQGAGAERARAGDYVQRDPVALCEHDTAAQALDRMSAHRVRRLPVLRGRRVVGMISYADLAGRVPQSHAVALLNRLTGGTPDQPSAAWLFARAYRRPRPDRARRQRRLDEATAAQAVLKLAASA